MACRRVILSSLCRHRLPPASLLASSSCSRRLVIPYLLVCLASLPLPCPLLPSPVVSRLIRLILFSFACLRVVLPPLCVRSCPPASRLVFASYRLSPRSPDKTGGAFFACLSLSRGSSSVSPPLLPFVFSCHCSPRGSLPFASCGRLSCPCPRSRSSSPSPLLVSRRPPSLPFLPALRQAWAGSVAARYLLACSRRSRLRFPRHAGGGLLLACLGWRAIIGGGWRDVGVAACLSLMASGDVVGDCVGFVLRLFVYINWMLARV